MQYQKDDIKNRIVVAALSEFKDMGYIDASMRRISKSSNVPLGNLYRYFKNKEDLFTSIVGPVYKNIRSFMNKILDTRIDTNEQNPSFTGLSQFKEIDDIKDELLEICKEHNTELLILMDKSKGSPYENVKEELIYVISDVFTKKLVPTVKNKESVIIKDSYFAIVLSASVVEGICFILRKYTDGQVLRQMTDQLLYVIYKDITERLI